MHIADREVRNALEEAVYGVFGGPTKASFALRVSQTVIHRLLSVGYISKRQTALEWEDATAAAGLRIPAAELMALAPWRGPSRSGHPALRADETAARSIASTRTHGEVAGARATVRPFRKTRRLVAVAIAITGLHGSVRRAEHPLDVPAADPRCRLTRRRRFASAA
jgi:hypothetical protein